MGQVLIRTSWNRGPPLPVVGYFIERSEDGLDWPIERAKSLLSFWLGKDGIPECMR